MATFLIVQGMDNVDLHESESFNKVRARINQAVTGASRDGSELPAKKAAQPLHDLTFLVEMGNDEPGRIAVNPEKVIGVGSDEPRDERAVEDEE